MKRRVCAEAAALFSVGMKRNELSLPKVSDQWRNKGKLEAVGRD